MSSADGKPTILTYSGRVFDFADPRPEMIEPEDIAQGLAMACRFAGQTRCFYSVAQHSVFASLYVPPADSRAALLHDAPEAFMNDIPKPLKRLLPDYQRIEERVHSAIFERFGLDPELPPSVKVVDGRLKVTEGRMICHENWASFPHAETPYTFGVGALGWEDARDLFLHRFRELFPNE